MAHWEPRPEPRWKKLRFNQPYAKGLRRLEGYTRLLEQQALVRAKAKGE